MKSLIEEMEASAEVVVLNPTMTLAAIHAHFAHSISWFDALIWAAAKAAGCTIIYTKDIPGVSMIDGVRYVNPLV